MYYELIMYDEDWAEKRYRFSTLKETEDYAETQDFSHYTIIKCEQVKLV